MENPNVNGYKFSWASIKIKRGSGNVFGFKAINYGNSIEEGEVRGHGRQQLGRTRGNLKASGGITFLAEEFYEFIDELGDGYMDKVFDFVVSREEGDLIRTDELLGCRITEDPQEDENGVDGSEVALTLSIMEVIKDGKRAIENAL